MGTSSVDHHTIPVHHSLTEPVLLAGAHRQAAILLWTVAAALAFPLGAWFLLPVAIGCHLGLAAFARSDTDGFAILKRALAYPDRYR